MLAIWSLVPLPFLKLAWTSGSSRFMYYWSLAWRILSITLLACAAAAAKSLQSCPTLCNPINGSLPGSPIPGILQARTLECVAISFSNALKHVRRVQLCGSLSILWHCLSFGLEWKVTFSSPVASYDLNQILYDYTVDVTSRFKGLDLIHRVPEELWMEVHDIAQEAVIKTIPMGWKMQKGKTVVWGGLTNSCEKKSRKRQRRKGKI